MWAAHLSDTLWLFTKLTAANYAEWQQFLGALQTPPVGSCPGDGPRGSGGAKAASGAAAAAAAGQGAVGSSGVGITKTKTKMMKTRLNCYSRRWIRRRVVDFTIRSKRGPTSERCARDTHSLECAWKWGRRFRRRRSWSGGSASQFARSS